MEEAKFRDYYRDLGVSPESAVREIKKAFYNLAKRHHPDKKGPESTNSDEFRKVREAFETLCDEEKRLRYDRDYARMRPKWSQSQKMQETPPAEEVRPAEDAARRMAEAEKARRGGAEKARREAEEKRQPLRKHKERKAEERSREVARRAQERQKLAAKERLRKDIEREAEARERQTTEARQRLAKLEMEESQEALRRSWGPVDERAEGWPNQVNDYYYFQGSHPQAAGWERPGENGYKPRNICSRSYARLSSR